MAEPVAQVTVQASTDFLGEPATNRRGWHAPCTVELSREDAGRDRRARGGQVHSTQATEQRERTSEGKPQCITNTKFPVNCWDRSCRGPPKKMTTPTAECEVELLESRRIITDELQTKRSAGEDAGDEHRRGEGKRHTITKAPSTGLVEEAIPTRTRQVHVRTPRKSGRENDAKVPVLRDQRQRNASKMHTAVRGGRVEDQRPWWLIWWDRHRKKTANEHSTRAQHRGPLEGQPATQPK